MLRNKFMSQSKQTGGSSIENKSGSKNLIIAVFTPLIALVLVISLLVTTLQGMFMGVFANEVELDTTGKYLKKISEAESACFQKSYEYTTEQIFSYISNNTSIGEIAGTEKALREIITNGYVSMRDYDDLNGYMQYDFCISGQKNIFSVLEDESIGYNRNAVFSDNGNIKEWEDRLVILSFVNPAEYETAFAETQLLIDTYARNKGLQSFNIVDFYLNKEEKYFCEILTDSKDKIISESKNFYKNISSEVTNAYNILSSLYEISCNVSDSVNNVISSLKLSKSDSEWLTNYFTFKTVRDEFVAKSSANYLVNIYAEKHEYDIVYKNGTVCGDGISVAMLENMFDWFYDYVHVELLGEKGINDYDENESIDINEDEPSSYTTQYEADRYSAFIDFISRPDVYEKLLVYEVTEAAGSNTKYTLYDGVDENNNVKQITVPNITKHNIITITVNFCNYLTLADMLNITVGGTTYYLRDNNKNIQDSFFKYVEDIDESKTVTDEDIITSLAGYRVTGAITACAKKGVKSVFNNESKKSYSNWDIVVSVIYDKKTKTAYFETESGIVNDNDSENKFLNYSGNGKNAVEYAITYTPPETGRTVSLQYRLSDNYNVDLNLALMQFFNYCRVSGDEAASVLTEAGYASPNLYWQYKSRMYSYMFIDPTADSISMPFFIDKSLVDYIEAVDTDSSGTTYNVYCEPGTVIYQPNSCYVDSIYGNDRISPNEYVYYNLTGNASLNDAFDKIEKTFNRNIELYNEHDNVKYLHVKNSDSITDLQIYHEYYFADVNYLYSLYNIQTRYYNGDNNPMPYLSSWDFNYNNYGIYLSDGEYSDAPTIEEYFSEYAKLKAGKTATSEYGADDEVNIRRPVILGCALASSVIEKLSNHVLPEGSDISTPSETINKSGFTIKIEAINTSDKYKSIDTEIDIYKLFGLSKTSDDLYTDSTSGMSWISEGVVSREKTLTLNSDVSVISSENNTVKVISDDMSRIITVTGIKSGISSAQKQLKAGSILFVEDNYSVYELETGIKLKTNNNKKELCSTQELIIISKGSDFIRYMCPDLKNIYFLDGIKTDNYTVGKRITNDSLILPLSESSPQIELSIVSGTGIIIEDAKEHGLSVSASDKYYSLSYNQSTLTLTLSCRYLQFNINFLGVIKDGNNYYLPSSIISYTINQTNFIPVYYVLPPLFNGSFIESSRYLARGEYVSCDLNNNIYAPVSGKVYKITNDSVTICDEDTLLYLCITGISPAATLAKNSFIVSGDKIGTANDYCAYYSIYSKNEQTRAVEFTEDKSVKLSYSAFVESVTAVGGNVYNITLVNDRNTDNSTIKYVYHNISLTEDLLAAINRYIENKSVLSLSVGTIIGTKNKDSYIVVKPGLSGDEYYYDVMSYYKGVNTFNESYARGSFIVNGAPCSSVIINKNTEESITVKFNLDIGPVIDNKNYKIAYYCNSMYLSLSSPDINNRILVSAKSYALGTRYIVASLYKHDDKNGWVKIKELGYLPVTVPGYASFGSMRIGFDNSAPIDLYGEKEIVDVTGEEMKNILISLRNSNPTEITSNAFGYREIAVPTIKNNREDASKLLYFSVDYSSAVSDRNETWNLYKASFNSSNMSYSISPYTGKYISISSESGAMTLTAHPVLDSSKPYPEIYSAANNPSDFYIVTAKNNESGSLAYAVIRIYQEPTAIKVTSYDYLYNRGSLNVSYHYDDFTQYGHMSPYGTLTANYTIYPSNIHFDLNADVKVEYVKHLINGGFGTAEDISDQMNITMENNKVSVRFKASSTVLRNYFEGGNPDNVKYVAIKIILSLSDISANSPTFIVTPDPTGLTVLDCKGNNGKIKGDKLVLNEDYPPEVSASGICTIGKIAIAGFKVAFRDNSDGSTTLTSALGVFSKMELTSIGYSNMLFSNSTKVGFIIDENGSALDIRIHDITGGYSLDLQFGIYISEKSVFRVENARFIVKKEES